MMNWKELCADVAQWAEAHRDEFVKDVSDACRIRSTSYYDPNRANMPFGKACRDMLEPQGPCRVELSCHSPGFTPLVLERMLRQCLGAGTITTSEMSIPESTGRELPAGITAGWSRD